MKRTNYALAVGILALLPALHSCKKAEVEESQQTSSIAQSSTIDYDAIGTKEENGQKILVFKSWQHFLQVKNSLVTLCSQHSERYLKPLMEQKELLEDEDGSYI